MAKRESITLLKELIADSTFHGIPRIVRSKSLFSKLIWATCFIVSSCFCIRMLYTAIHSYLMFEIVVDINYYTEIPAKFPFLNDLIISFSSMTLFQRKLYLVEIIWSLKNLLQRVSWQRWEEKFRAA